MSVYILLVLDYVLEVQINIIIMITPDIILRTFVFTLKCEH